MKSKLKTTNLNIILIILSLLVTLVAGYCYKNTYGEIIRNCVMCLIMVMVYLFAYARYESEHALLFDNANRKTRNTLIFCAGIVMACALSSLPVTGWPYPLIFTVMALCTGTLPGIIAGSAMLMLTVIFSGTTYGVFCIYFIAGVVSVLLFSDMGKSFHTVLPIIIQTLLYFFLLAFIILFYLTGPIAWESFLIPLFNIFINTILMLIVCRHYNDAYLDKEKNIYSTINDQTFILLEECKQHNPKEYFRAIHTSYFTQLIADATHANIFLCKGGGYYARLEHFSENYHHEDMEELMDENHFPDQLKELLLKCQNKKSSTLVFSSKEEFVVELSTSLIDAIMKDKENKQDILAGYEGNVKKIFKSYYDHHCLEHLEITFEEYKKLENTLIREKKYLQMM